MDTCPSIFYVNHDYKSLTLNSVNERKRLSYLPCFPVCNTDQDIDSSQLLLVNVPRCCLSFRQILQRDLQHMNSTVTSSSYLIYMFEKHFAHLMRYYKVSRAIIDFNLTRLQSFISTELSSAFILNYDEMAMVLEFFLQFDVDLFYMKLCSFTTKSDDFLSTQSLFLNEGTIDPCHSLQPCKLPTCNMCSTTSDEMIYFDHYEIHRFINGYESILNTAANCRTKNIIYAFKCPCNQYEFIGSTSESLRDVLQYYRTQLTRFLQEHLNGMHTELYSTAMSSDSKCTFASVNDSLLYQHVKECSFILNRFLQYNPSYACFVPTLVTNDHENDDVDSISLNVQRYVANLPKFPSNFQFTRDQRRQQIEFYEHFLTERTLLLCSPDLYHVKLLCVLPESASDSVRTVIQHLFILHGEPNLN